MQKNAVAIATLAISVLILAGLYFAFARMPSEPPPRIPTPSAGAPVPDPPPPSAAQTPAPVPAPVLTAPAAPSAAAAEAGIFHLTIAKPDGNAPAAVRPALAARQGETITLMIATERAGTLEVHGYGQKVTVKPGTEAKLSFTADRAGRFPIDLHASDGQHVEVSALEVRPR